MDVSLMLVALTVIFKNDYGYEFNYSLEENEFKLRKGRKTLLLDHDLLRYMIKLDYTVEQIADYYDTNFKGKLPYATLRK